MNNGTNIKIPSPNKPEGLRGHSPLDEKLNGIFPINHKSLSFIEYHLPKSKPNLKLDIGFEPIDLKKEVYKAFESFGNQSK